MAVSVLTALLSYGIALCGIAPLIPWLSPAPRRLLAAGLLAGMWQSWRGAWRIKPWLSNGAAIAGVMVYALQVTRSNLVPPLADMLALMLAVRLTGEKNSRYYLQIYALSIFCLAASSLFDLSLTFLIYLAAMLFLVAMALMLLTFLDHDRRMVLTGIDLRRVIVAGLLMPAASVPLLAIFFPLLPRTQVPLWNFQAASAARLTGLADQVEPGRTGAIEESSRLVFRAEMPRQTNGQPYWRAVVFNRLAGASWQRDTGIPAEQIRYGDSPVRQEIYPEPGLSQYLPALDAPARISGLRATRSPDGVFTSLQKSSRRRHYSADSDIGGVLPVSGAIDREYYLQFPRDLAPRITALANGIKTASDDGQRLERLEQQFRGGGYRYVMRGMPTGGQALERFLFDDRQGNCEFFAAAFGLVARAAGLPARLVGGYLGGEYNDMGGYYAVRDQMAHVWVEIYLEGQGWVRSDPSRFATNADELWSDTRSQSLWARLGLLLDSLNHAWNRSVITYDFERQFEVAVTIGKRFQAFPVKSRLAALMGTAVLALLTATLLIVLLRKRTWRLFSPEERLLDHFHRRLAADCGLRVEPGTQGLFELAGRSGSANAREFAAIYAAAVYRDRRLTREERTRLRKLLATGFAEGKEHRTTEPAAAPAKRGP